MQRPKDTPDGSWKGVLKEKRLGSDNLRERLDALPELLILQDISTAERNFCKAQDENDERLFRQHIVTALTQHPRKKPLVLPELAVKPPRYEMDFFYRISLVLYPLSNSVLASDAYVSMW